MLSVVHTHTLSIGLGSGRLGPGSPHCRAQRGHGHNQGDKATAKDEVEDLAHCHAIHIIC